MARFTATHVEHHPVGNELTLKWCRALAVGVDDDSGWVVLDGSATVISENDAMRYEDEFLPLASPVEVGPNDGLLVLGPGYAAWLAVLAGAMPEGDEFIEALLAMTADVYGLRPIPASEPVSASIQGALGLFLCRVFDTELCGSRNPVIARVAWQCIETSTAVPVYDRVIRGIRYLEEFEDREQVERLLREYEVIEGLEREQIAVRYREYDHRLRGELERTLTQRSLEVSKTNVAAPAGMEAADSHTVRGLHNELLALNSKMDQLVLRTQRETFRAATGPDPSGSALTYAWTMLMRRQTLSAPWPPLYDISGIPGVANVDVFEVFRSIIGTGHLAVSMRHVAEETIEGDG